MSNIRRGVIAPIVFGVLGVAVLLFLGTWQVQRLDWKESLIAQIEARMAADPVELPASPDPERDHYLRVSVQGRLAKAELDVITSIKTRGPGFRVIVPMELGVDTESTGRKIMVDMGYVPEKWKNLFDRPDSVRTKKRFYKDKVVGVLRWPNETDSYTPPPDKERGIWFARDVEAMAAALGTEPVLIVAESHPDGDMPLPRPPGIDLPNKHLEYALTWFGLAIVWAIMSVALVRSQLRRARRA